MQLGKFNLQIISAGTWALDGGTVFGIVPRNLWSRFITPDEQNRVRLALNCLLVQTGKENILIDCGVGNWMSPKLRDVYNLCGEGDFLDNIRRHCPLESISYIILSHLHFDHAGGICYYDVENQLKENFPRARIVVQAAEWEAANHPSLRTRGSYFKNNIQAIKEHGRIELAEGDRKVAEGVEVICTGGHSAGHQIVRLSSEGETALYMGDIIPTAAHLQLPYITAFDIAPEQTLQVKNLWVHKALEEQCLMVFCHDVNIPAGYVGLKQSNERKEYVLTPASL